MRLVALGLAAAALAFPAAGAASANSTCQEIAAGAGVCVHYTCNDHHCINRTYTAVSTTCRHPFQGTCRTVYLPSST